MKKVIIALSALVLLLSLAGCGTNGNSKLSEYNEYCRKGDSELSYDADVYGAKYYYEKAIELLPNRAEAYVGLAKAEIMDAEQEMAKNSAADLRSRYRRAAENYEKAAECDKKNHEYYIKAADYYLLAEKSENALDVLKLGKKNTVEKDLFKKRIAELESAVSAESSFKQLPYYGDMALCTMTAAQAKAYAELLDKNEFGRMYAALCDLGGDGVPFLVLTDNWKDDKSGSSAFTIYGWDGYNAVLIKNYKGYDESGYYRLVQDENGKAYMLFEGYRVDKVKDIKAHDTTRTDFSNGAAEEPHEFSFWSNDWWFYTHGAVRDGYTESDIGRAQRYYDELITEKARNTFSWDTPESGILAAVLEKRVKCKTAVDELELFVLTKSMA